jgi:hypothetical protein
MLGRVALFWCKTRVFGTCCAAIVQPRNLISLKQMNTNKRWVCVLGTNHLYQDEAYRKGYFLEVRDVLSTYKVDFVGEEYSKATASQSYAQRLVEKEYPTTSWKNVDLTRSERQKIPDKNPTGLGPVQDLDFQIAREKAWVDRVSAGTKQSALLICGLAHTFSVSQRFRDARFEVEVRVFLDGKDHQAIRERVE